MTAPIPFVRDSRRLMTARRRAPATKLRAAAPIVPAAAFGALVAYFCDPRSGRRRRHTARDRTFARLRRTERQALISARRAESRALGRMRRAVNSRMPHEPLDDITLAHKVESTLFRDRTMPKGRISINAEDGVVFLRGAVDSQETIDAAEQAARRVQGVRGVENLLHLPASPPPSSRPKLVRERTRRLRALPRRG